jgi:hypothetical protein
MSLSPFDFQPIRAGLAELPRANNHAPGERVDPNTMVMVAGHRAALDPDRTLVVGNRGMGKSFWAHALAEPRAREEAARTFQELSKTDVCFGFNASERSDDIAPTPSALEGALATFDDPDILWRAVLVRVALKEGVASPTSLPNTLSALAAWVQTHGEDVDRLLTALDDKFAADGRRLLIVFDALDRLGNNWQTTRRLTSALLKRAVAVRSYRALRLKLFMRRDQFEDRTLFQFPDGSKVRNTRVDLTWTTGDLWNLLFSQLSRNAASSQAFEDLRKTLVGQQPLPNFDNDKVVVDAIAGEFMGANEKRGRVYTWLPLHLSDARGETSPRTFLTAWREAALHGTVPGERAVDHLGILEGVRKASEDRLHELKEDYWWIRLALEPLRGQMVPMERTVLEGLWQKNGTIDSIRNDSSSQGGAPIQLEDSPSHAEAGLLDALTAIGIMEVRSNGKINVPDIFRVEAEIKRKGGVKPPRRTPPSRP